MTTPMSLKPCSWQIFIDDVVMLKIGRYWPWKTITVSSHLHMPVRPILLHHMALVSFLLFCKNLGNLREFFGQTIYRPLWQKIARTPMPSHKTSHISSHPQHLISKSAILRKYSTRETHASKISSSVIIFNKASDLKPLCSYYRDHIPEWAYWGGHYWERYQAPTKPLFQSEATCEAIDMKMFSYSQANKTHFHKKGFALNSV